MAWEANDEVRVRNRLREANRVDGSVLDGAMSRERVSPWTFYYLDDAGNMLAEIARLRGELALVAQRARAFW